MNYLYKIIFDNGEAIVSAKNEFYVMAILNTYLQYVPDYRQVIKIGAGFLGDEVVSVKENDNNTYEARWLDNHAIIFASSIKSARSLLEKELGVDKNVLIKEIRSQKLNGLQGLCVFEKLKTPADLKTKGYLVKNGNEVYVVAAKSKGEAKRLANNGEIIAFSEMRPGILIKSTL